MPKSTNTPKPLTVSTVLPAELGPRIAALRLEGGNIYSVSTVVREAIKRGLAQIEKERSMGIRMFDEPVIMPVPDPDIIV